MLNNNVSQETPVLRSVLDRNWTIVLLRTDFNTKQKEQKSLNIKYVLFFFPKKKKKLKHGCIIKNVNTDALNLPYFDRNVL